MTDEFIGYLKHRLALADRLVELIKSSPIQDFDDAQDILEALRAYEASK